MCSHSLRFIAPHPTPPFSVAGLFLCLLIYVFLWSVWRPHYVICSTLYVAYVITAVCVLPSESLCVCVCCGVCACVLGVVSRARCGNQRYFASAALLSLLSAHLSGSLPSSLFALTSSLHQHRRRCCYHCQALWRAPFFMLVGVSLCAFGIMIKTNKRQSAQRAKASKRNETKRKWKCSLKSFLLLLLMLLLLSLSLLFLLLLYSSWKMQTESHCGTHKHTQTNVPASACTCKATGQFACVRECVWVQVHVLVCL